MKCVTWFAICKLISSELDAKWQITDEAFANRLVMMICQNPALGSWFFKLQIEGN